MSIIEILLRAIISFVGLVFWARIIGKKLISHLTFFDFVAGVTFGSIGGNLIFNPSVSLLVGVIGLTMFSILVLLSDYISLKSFIGRKLLDSEPQIIIREGQILMENMKRVRLTIDELLMLLRKKDAFYIDEIDFAFMETDGTLSIMKKTNSMSITRADMNIKGHSRGIPHACIIDGKIIEENLKNIQKDSQWMKIWLKENNVKLEHVLLAQIDQQDGVFINLKTNM
ncbi:Uncharacterized membrane protein YcaP, DUF421 family [Paenibacillus sp. 1_12]|uniref:DUF421 domain-containing protein n=1 Tax=Paenibacillus sp. 1_12 TaxID=1566278 RepID=UPI0008E59F57|nr:DUF421 domain-containing protein [Paenibacillus sp. 1_12]SFL00968.1 Uncharacterized membrane protein YcaP, DUF421 family [Paenibacillus sp. 1_12]